MLCCNTHICHSPRILAWRKSVIRRDECLRQMTTGAMNQSMLHTYSSDPVCLVCQLCHEWGCGLHKNLHEHPIPVFCTKKKTAPKQKTIPVLVGYFCAPHPQNIRFPQLLQRKNPQSKCVRCARCAWYARCVRCSKWCTASRSSHQGRQLLLINRHLIQNVYWKTNYLCYTMMLRLPESTKAL